MLICSPWPQKFASETDIEQQSEAALVTLRRPLILPVEEQFAGMTMVSGHELVEIT